MSQDKLMIGCAIVIERASNGVIVRPHQGWWQRDENSTYRFDEVKVFNDLKDFERWFTEFFPKEPA